MTSTAVTVIRPFREGAALEADVDGADEMAFASLDELGQRMGFAMGHRDAARIAWARARIRHLVITDPGGSFVAEVDGRIVGVGLAIRRGDLWFLSLLAVETGLQARGIGGQLLDATLEYGKDCGAAMVCASPDPKALRRYGRAGFELHAAYEASGKAHLREIPADLGVRDGDWDRDRGLIEDIIVARRGEPYGTDLDWCRERGMELYIRDGGTPQDRAFAFARRGRIATVGGASGQAAARVLWAAIASAPDEITIGYLLGNQQWAISVALAAGLPLKLTDTLCTRGTLSPPTPYLPSGIFG
jgi:predicted N-acetyltransferase YhbS